MSVFGVILVRIFPAFSRIRTEYGEILRISPDSVKMRENKRKMRTRITPNTDTFYAVHSFHWRKVWDFWQNFSNDHTQTRSIDLYMRLVKEKKIDVYYERNIDETSLKTNKIPENIITLARTLTYRQAGGQFNHSKPLLIETNMMLCAIWYHLYNFKKREKHPWRSVTFSKVAG